jgi:hypothetical protein
VDQSLSSSCFALSTDATLERWKFIDREELFADWIVVSTRMDATCLASIQRLNLDLQWDVAVLYIGQEQTEAWCCTCTCPDTCLAII